MRNTSFDTDMMFGWQAADHRVDEGIGTKLRAGSESSDNQTNELEQIYWHIDLEPKFGGIRFLW
jgi:hypothetical protein